MLLRCRVIDRWLPDSCRGGLGEFRINDTSAWFNRPSGIQSLTVEQPGRPRLRSVAEFLMDGDS